MRAGDRESCKEYLDGLQRGLAGAHWMRTLASRVVEAKGMYSKRVHHKGTKGTKTTERRQG
jgi:hypothetical protein